MFTSPGEVAFHIGPISIYYYGIVIAVALCSGVLFSRFVVRKYYPELAPDVIYDVAPVVIVGAILGARLYYCLLNFSYYCNNILEVFAIRHGGISIHGAILGGLIFGAIYTYKHKLPLLKLCDIFSYGLILGQAIGRWGNFFNSEAFGLPSNNFLKLYIPIYKRPLEYIQYEYFHPTFLYESILDIIIFLILFFIIRKITKNKNGIIFFSYLILYSLVRIIVEQIRVDSILNISGIPVAQIVSAIIMVFAIMGILVIGRKAN